MRRPRLRWCAPRAPAFMQAPFTIPNWPPRGTRICTVERSKGRARPGATSAEPAREFQVGLIPGGAGNARKLSAHGGKLAGEGKNLVMQRRNLVFPRRIEESGQLLAEDGILGAAEAGARMVERDLPIDP